MTNFKEYPENKPSTLSGKGKILCLCECPDWCSLGYQVAEYSQQKQRFDYDDAPNDWFDKDVTGWMILVV